MNSYERITKKYLKEQKAKHQTKSKRIFTIFDVVFLTCFFVAIIIGFFFSFPINRMLNNETLEQVSNITINNGVKAHVLDVGQALSVVVELPDNKILLYDAGLQDTGDYVVKYIKKLTESKVIDCMVLSHTDSDHIGGAIKILDNFEVKNVVRPIVKSAHSLFDEVNNSIINTSLMSDEYTAINDELYAIVLKKIDEENCNIHFADYNNVNLLNKIFDGRNYNIDFYIPSFTTSSQMNDFSSVITINHEAKTLMITGDATERTERYLLNEYNLPDIDFLVVAHHGSKTTTTLEFLQKVKPSYAYISVSSTNSYNHPDQNTINRLLHIGISESRIYKTSECNDIVLAFGRDGVQHYYQSFEVKYVYIVLGLILVILVVYFEKIKKLGVKVYKKSVEITQKRKVEKNNKLI